MIEVKYDRRHLTVTVTGHAKSDEPGKDLVCAAATILTYTLAGNAESLAEDHSKFHYPGAAHRKHAGRGGRDPGRDLCRIRYFAKTISSIRTL